MAKIPRRLEWLWMSMKAKSSPFRLSASQRCCQRHSRHLRNFGWQMFCLKSCTKTFRFCCRIIVVMPVVASFVNFGALGSLIQIKLSYSHPPWIYTTWKLMQSRSRNIGTFNRSRILLIAIASSPFLESKLTSCCSAQKGLAFPKPS